MIDVIENQTDAIPATTWQRISSSSLPLRVTHTRLLLWLLLGLPLAIAAAAYAVSGDGIRDAVVVLPALLILVVSIEAVARLQVRPVQVEIGPDALRIIKGNESGVYPYEDLRKISTARLAQLSYIPGLYVDFITLHFHRETRFGKVVTFLPSSENGVRALRYRFNHGARRSS